MSDRQRFFSDSFKEKRQDGTQATKPVAKQPGRIVQVIPKEKQVTMPIAS